MTDISRTMNVQTRQLEEAMRKEVDGEARAATDAAHREAATIVEAARRTARERMRQAVKSMRQERTSQLNKARARLAMAERAWRQRLVTELIEAGMEMLREALAERWQDKDCRRQWALGLVEDAKDRLERGLWSIEHPVGWKASRDKALVAALTQASGNVPGFTPLPTIMLGLRIRSGQACLDGTGEGLLAQRQWIEAEMLAMIEQSGVAGIADP